MTKLGWLWLASLLLLSGSSLCACSQGDQEVQDLLSKYSAGKREFVTVRLKGADLQGQDLRWINFAGRL